MLKFYLDTSAIVKRYVVEPGTKTVDVIFDKAETGELVISLSIWNIGEALGVFDKRCRKKWLTQEEFTKTLNILAEELIKLMRLRVLEIFPTHTLTLTGTWPIILTNHIYEADALQIIAYMQTNSDAFVSSDKRLIKISRKMGLKAFHIMEDEEEITSLLEH